MIIALFERGRVTPVVVNAGVGREILAEPRGDKIDPALAPVEVVRKEARVAVAAVK